MPCAGFSDGCRYLGFKLEAGQGLLCTLSLPMEYYAHQTKAAGATRLTRPCAQPIRGNEESSCNPTPHTLSCSMLSHRQRHIACHKLETLPGPAQVDALIEEYFNSGDIQEASTTLQELDEPEYGHFFVKRAVTRALDKHNHEREMSSILLSALYGEVRLWLPS